MKLKDYLFDKGIKQKWLAQQIGVSEVTMSCWCNGKARPYPKHRDRISQVLNLPSELLFEIQ